MPVHHAARRHGRRSVLGATALTLIIASLAVCMRKTAVHFHDFLALRCGMPAQFGMVAGRSSSRRQSSAVIRHVSERAAYVAVVDVNATEGSEAVLAEACLENARNSVFEPLCQRFDVLQSVDEPRRFALVEIYRNAKGPADHKATAHYQAWREGVAEITEPRAATQWDTIFPSLASGYAPTALILERSVPDYFDVTHVFVDVAPGSEDAFIEATLANAKASVRESDNLRFDVLRSVEDPTKFLLIEVYRSAKGVDEHKETEHYLAWREAVAQMMASPRKAIKYRNLFPNLVAGWQTEGDLTQAGGKNWAR